MPNKKTAKKKAGKKGQSKKRPMSEKLIHFLYDLAVNRDERHKFFEDPRGYLARKGKDLDPEDRDLLIREGEKEQKLIEKRKTTKQQLKRKPGEFEEVFGKMFLQSTDDGPDPNGPGD